MLKEKNKEKEKEEVEDKEEKEKDKEKIDDGSVPVVEVDPPTETGPPETDRQKKKRKLDNERNKVGRQDTYYQIDHSNGVYVTALFTVCTLQLLTALAPPSEGRPYQNPCCCSSTRISFVVSFCTGCQD